MGGTASKQEFRTAVLDLVNSKQSVTGMDNSYWDRFWSDPTLTPLDYFTLVTFQDIRDLRDKASGNLTALCFKLVERISTAASTACSGENEQNIIVNCVSLLTRLLPFLFEEQDWRLLFWTPANFLETHGGEQPQALAQVLLNSIADLLFCPDFTVLPQTKAGPENPDDLSSLDSCEYIWEAGIGCTVSPGTTKELDTHRMVLIKLLITCFSETLYLPPSEPRGNNRWLSHFVSPENRHVLPLLTSLINVVCSYDPVGYGVPYYYAMVRDPRGDLVEASVHLLCILLDYIPPSDFTRRLQQQQAPPTNPAQRATSSVMQEQGMGNLFCSFLSRLHQNEDLEFITKGLTTLLCNPLRRTYLPHSIKKIFFTQELYIIFWKLFELNHKFMMHILRSPCLFDLVVPLLQQLLETRTNPALVGMLHVGVFILLLLSGERNFGVRLNKPYVHRITLPDIPKFSGTHADLLFLVFHKIITSGLPRLQPLYDCLLTVLVNVSPYLKSLSMVTCARLMHLMESFSTQWFLFAKPTNHYLVFYLLEIFNNIIQYQFDGNTNMIYSIIRSKGVFYQLANLPEDSYQLGRPKPQPRAISQQKGGGGSGGSEGRGAMGEEGGMAAAREEQPQQPEPPRGDPALHMADIKPPGQIRTVEVEVEPLPDGEEDNDGREEGEEREAAATTTAVAQPEPAAVERDGKEGDRPGEETVATGSAVDGEDEGGREEQSQSGPEQLPPQATPQAPPTSATMAATAAGVTQAPPPSHTQPSPPPPQGMEAAQRPDSFGLDHPSPITRLPPLMSPADDISGQRSPAGGKKKSKPKPLSNKDLMACHQDIARSNRELVEPSTPEFKPTSEWVRSWKQKLPLNTVLRLLQVLVPQVEKLCNENEVKSEHEVLDYLKNGTLVGLLPVPHPILIRKYQTSENTEQWFHTYIWGVVYVRNYDPPIWYDTTIKLFQVHKVTAPASSQEQTS